MAKTWSTAFAPVNRRGGAWSGQGEAVEKNAFHSFKPNEKLKNLGIQSLNPSIPQSLNSSIPQSLNRFSLKRSSISL